MAESREAAILRDANNVVGTALANESKLRDRNRKLLAANIKLKAERDRYKATLSEIAAYEGGAARWVKEMASKALSDERNTE